MPMKLNTFAAYLVPLLGRPLSEFTELQRALKEGSSHFKEDPDKPDSSLKEARETVMQTRPGPGGGVEADPFRVTFFVLALMVDATRKLAASTTWEAWHMEVEDDHHSRYSGDPAREPKVCGLTGSPLFGEALKLVLDDEDLARRVDRVSVSGRDWAEIAYDDGKVSRFQRFSKPYSQRLTKVLNLDGEAVAMITGLLKRDNA